MNKKVLIAGSDKKMIKYGLKLWSDNEHYISQADKLFREKVYDYIELYILPGTYDRYINIWRSLNIPFIIHCTHSLHGFNPALKETFQSNLRIFSEVKAFCDELHGKYIIFHPGIKGSVEECIEQIRSMNDKRLLVENMPYISMFGDHCRGSLYQELDMIINSSKVGFCLDIPHAITTAFLRNIDSFDYMKMMLNLTPAVLHMSDGTKEKHDKHLNIGDGHFNFGEIKKAIALSNAKYLTIETRKGSNGLDDFVEDLKKLKDINKNGKDTRRIIKQLIDNGKNM